uniref:Uncharacterized protein n=1 Tax=Pristionchus pacificus TaxID=54126 RepID=A0A2A6CFH8_PRIPA|eukprot:PDM76761.1 hypothetical protein PRIPAC_42156 [Pristionchus pacificus]
MSRKDKVSLKEPLLVELVELLIFAETTHSTYHKHGFGIAASQRETSHVVAPQRLKETVACPQPPAAVDSVTGGELAEHTMCLHKFRIIEEQ